MSAVELALLAVGGWFAFNMGASGLAPAFGATIGARLISPRWAALVFGIFVIAGALLLGPNVAKTLGSGIVPGRSFDTVTTLIVLGAANVALLLANLLKMPQSTSWVTVAAIVTLGLHQRDLNTEMLTHRLLPAWLVLPLAGFVISAGLMKYLYPLDGSRFGLHSWLSQRTGVMRGLAFASACYVALAIGANNVANAVGPCSAAGLFSVGTGMLLLAPMFGLGAGVLAGPAKTIARDVVPLGLFAATICNVVVATLLIVASYMGLPQSLVQMNAAAVLGVALVKEGHSGMLDGRGTRRMLMLWIVTPILAAGLTWIALTLWR
ncbi:MAG: inorganic phosphate transporter [Deltaproteobacteria bacterium]|nr:inorganic phosphate transporter [Deltaproteobacteria bacterium]